MLTEKDMDGVQDMQKEPWFCKKHNFQTIHNWVSGPDDWICPECDELICKAWEEVNEEGNNELSYGFPLLRDI